MESLAKKDWRIVHPAVRGEVHQRLFLAQFLMVQCLHSAVCEGVSACPRSDSRLLKDFVSRTTTPME